MSTTLYFENVDWFSLPMDRISKMKRSANMAAIPSRNTGPEINVRRILHDLGVGYRLHDRELPGRPDIVMKGRRRAIFVHGCFWHRHRGCKYAYEPKSRQEFWQTKFAGNVERDRLVLRRLRLKGWRVLVIWECEAANAKLARRRLVSFLDLSQ